MEKMNSIRHPNIIEIIGKCRSTNELSFVMEFMDNGSLADCKLLGFKHTLGREIELLKRSSYHLTNSLLKTLRGTRFGHYFLFSTTSVLLKQSSCQRQKFISLNDNFTG